VTRRLDELLDIMARLRAPDGCPWDREQTFASIAPHTIEEAYEVADAITQGDHQHLRDELGDLLFQVVFLAQIANELGLFDFDAVAGSICDKLLRRHPHVFAGAAQVTAAEQSRIWEDIKAEERRAAGVRALGAAGGAVSAQRSPQSHLDGVPRALPALLRAHKLSLRAARAGFDFDVAGDAADKVTEELAEVRSAATAGRYDGAATGNGVPPSDALVEEVGDLLFAAANLARKLRVNPEASLRAANDKFERRFRAMETLAAGRGESFDALQLAAQEILWQEVKRGE
jgi:nucleoside triphosphate diphosphatase